MGSSITEPVTAEELFSKSLLLVPPADKLLTLEKLATELEHTGGVYVYYNKYGECLYVGISSDLASRVPAHLHLGRGNSDLFEYIQLNEGVTVEIRYEQNSSYRELYESYLINQFEPRFNVAKSMYERL